MIAKQTMKYVSGSRIGSFSSELIGQCLSAIKKLELGLTDGELVQIANLAPESEVELYLVRSRT